MASTDQSWDVYANSHVRARVRGEFREGRFSAWKGQRPILLFKILSTTEDRKIDRKAVTYGRNILTVGVRMPYSIKIHCRSRVSADSWSNDLDGRAEHRCPCHWAIIIGWEIKRILSIKVGGQLWWIWSAIISGFWVQWIWDIVTINLWQK